MSENESSIRRGGMFEYFSAGVGSLVGLVLAQYFPVDWVSADLIPVSSAIALISIYISSLTAFISWVVVRELSNRIGNIAVIFFLLSGILAVMWGVGDLVFIDEFKGRDVQVKADSKCYSGAGIYKIVKIFRKQQPVRIFDRNWRKVHRIQGDRHYVGFWYHIFYEGNNAFSCWVHGGDLISDFP